MYKLSSRRALSGTVFQGWSLRCLGQCSWCDILEILESLCLKFSSELSGTSTQDVSFLNSWSFCVPDFELVAFGDLCLG